MVSERKLANHQAGTLLPAGGLHVLSSAVVDSVRTVIVTRPMHGAAYSFAAGTTPTAVITAVGASGTFGYHKHRAASTLSFAKAGGGDVCVCRDGSSNTGTINGIPFNPHVCAPFPTSELLTTHNAICNISAYGGGLYCCHDGVQLLDADQPINPKTDTFHMKYRFYYEDFANQTNSFRVWWSTEATNNE